MVLADPDGVATGEEDAPLVACDATGSVVRRALAFPLTIISSVHTAPTACLTFPLA